MNEITDYEITETMVRFGGSFVSGLGELFRKADDDNRARLRAAFPEYWDTYRELAAAALKASQKVSAS